MTLEIMQWWVDGGDDRKLKVLVIRDTGGDAVRFHAFLRAGADGPMLYSIWAVEDGIPRKIAGEHPDIPPIANMPELAEEARRQQPLEHKSPLAELADAMMQPWEPPK